MGNRKRVFGDQIGFKSLSCAPANELGVVYVFGELHETFDLKIESIQSGFPDSVARRKKGQNRWEEVRIEFVGLFTSCRTRDFFSHRKEKKTGRFATVIALQ